MLSPLRPVPDWTVNEWFNTPKPLSLSDLRGKIVVVEAFQMLCPGCVSHGLPLAQKVHETFNPDDVAVIGLHTVFEHHDAMKPVSLKAFLHEYRIKFPVGVDAPGEHGMPETMARYRLRGTPSLLLIDRQGNLAGHHFGHVSELKLGAEIGALVAQAVPSQSTDGPTGADSCDDNGCTP